MKHTLIVAALLALGLFASAAQAEIKVITTDTTLASIAREVGGDKVKVESLSRGPDDPHHVEPTPSMVLKLARADLFARIGMDLDGWADSALERSGNSKVMRNGAGYVECANHLKVMEIPPAKLDPSMGDIHVYGNPHYLMDPANGILAAGNIAAGLIKVDPKNQPYYHQRFVDFGNRIKAALDRWRAQLGPFRGSAVTTYHRSWVYFMARFGLKEYGTIEPRPGIQPSLGHVNDLVRGMKNDKVKAILVENFRKHNFPDMIAQQTGAKVAYVPLAVDAEAGLDSYFKLFDAIVGRLAAALK
jgi:zinc/manganese transport system substrate-binding protein